MNRGKLIIEALYWLVENTEVRLDKLDSKQIIQKQLGKQLFKDIINESNTEQKIKTSLEANQK